MTKKNGSIMYKCSKCGYSQPRWLGRCPECGEWNSLEEIVIDKTKLTPAGKGSEFSEKAKPVSLNSIQKSSSSRIMTGNTELDRVLGGGATKKSVILLGGEPGIGKSTLLLQAASSCSKNLTETQVILYVSGEESPDQIKERAERLKVDCSKIQLLCTSRLEDILDTLDLLKPVFIIIDSIQTIYSIEAGLIPGTINQLKYCSNELISWVKEHESFLIMTAHITKEGTIAGPKSLEHMVDTVISFERNNDDYRFLHSLKNRFGSIDEIGIFSMDENGLKTVANPGKLFICDRKETNPSGVCRTPVLEGTRIFIVEIQALTVPAKASLSRIYSEKIDSGRIARIAAVIEKKCGITFSDQDIYINVAGGIKLSESSIDAAIAAALYSARTDLSIPNSYCVFGELSLAGEVGKVSKGAQRIKNAKSTGYNNILCAESENCIHIDSIKDLIKNTFAK